MKTISLIISVYKKVKELEILLTALKRQSCKDFDVIIADDGSGDIISDFVKEFRKTCDYEIIFLTQEDAGFRKNKILNEAVRTSVNEYLIFLDSDCIPHKDFVKAHFDNSEKNTVLVGRRIHLNEKLSDMLTPEFVLTDDFDRLYLRALKSSIGFRKSTYTAEEGIIIRNKLLRKLLNIRNYHIVGCNFSLSKELLLEINGFDENYVGAGIGEDSDIEYRLGLINAKFKSVRNLAVVFHMYHEKTKEDNTNYDYFHNNVKTKNNFYCENGIFKPYKFIQTD
ncbi:MAG: glycosyltransferase [Ignavibacteria bacterium]|nr:glycosyltransferase [Ignavibacteria bacterium]